VSRNRDIETDIESWKTLDLTKTYPRQDVNEVSIVNQIETLSKQKVKNKDSNVAFATFQSP